MKRERNRAGADIVAGLHANLAQRRPAPREQSLLDWALRVPEPKTGTLDFDRFPFQRELYEQGAADKEVVIKKSTQVGISAFAVRWALYWADTRGWTGLYVFPTKGDVHDFSAARIKPAIEGSPYLRGRMTPGEVDRMGLKRVDRGFVYFRGSESKRGLDSVDADHIVFDEYDTLAQDNIPDAERRITGTLHGLIRRVGVPSVPLYGIAGLYDDTDRREWVVKCDACGEWQELDFWKNVDMERAIRVCAEEDCRKPLDVAKGAWVPEFPDRDVRGYHVSRLIAPLADVADIIKQSKKKTAYQRQVFYNKDLGLEFAPEEGRLSLRAIQAAQTAGGGFGMTDFYDGGNLVTMGIDVASTRDLNVRISEHWYEGETPKKRGLWIGHVASFDGLVDKMRNFRVNMACIDHAPEGRMARQFANQFPGQVFLVRYNSPSSKEVMIVDDEAMIVSVKRVEAIDAMTSMIRQQRNQLPDDLPPGYVAEMQALVRTAERDAHDRQKVEYLRSGPADDYAHAETYDMVAGEVWRYMEAKNAITRSEYRALDDILEGFERSHLGDLNYDEDMRFPDRDNAFDPLYMPEDDSFSGGWRPD